ncbi:TATA box-binding protein-associated factor RNA polymerase I subunit B-like [Bidens hawaiensis]|uniref:TATA box-binding protein-associated factor RNA polymerase I subunit B-like n=1 Tax=Bidens hawaiensis TaxID=980011 RepID=UPI00404A09F3
MVDGSLLKCQYCGFVGLEGGPDNSFYYMECELPSDDIKDAADGEDDMLFTQEKVKAMVRRRVVKHEPGSQSQPLSSFWQTLMTQEDVDADAGGPSSVIRKTYVMGLQLMIQMQVKVLVEECNVCPVIVGMVESVWLRFMASTKLFKHDWTLIAIEESGVSGRGEQEAKSPTRNELAKRCLTIWHQSLSKTIPLSYTLVISFLVCHLAREPILPTDIIKWTLEGKLPYFTAFVEIGKQMGTPLGVCPLSSSRMFKPIQAISAEKLESLAASIAHSIGLELPPVNFYAIASRYLKQLSLTVNIILPHACRIYEWSMPPELWLSANEARLPTRAFVLSILIVSIRILYNIHGFGKWEMSLSCAIKRNNVAEVSDQSNMDATDILVLLQSKYNELIDTSDYAKDLERYLKFCKDVVFGGVELPSEDNEENEMINDLWNFYQKKEDHKPYESCSSGASIPDKRPLDHPINKMNQNKKPRDDNVEIIHGHKESYKEKEIRRMKSDMKENKLSYIPPRRRVKRHDYLHYTRKKGSGAYVYAAHADYYILLRSCVRVAQLDVRSMHDTVLSFERRLDWLENNIQHSLKQTPFLLDCELCHDEKRNL